MNYSQDGISLTEQFEGCRTTAYQDSVGIWTLGYGHIAGVKEGDTCTVEQAAEWLAEDIQNVVFQINRDIKIPLSQSEFDALVDFGFNLGVHALETSTLWAKLNQGDFAGAAAEFPKWDHAGGQVIQGLLQRRLQEQAEFNQGGS